MQNSNALNCARPALLALKHLKRGDHVTVVWCDASESTGVPVRQPIHNHTIESVCTAVGIFHSLQKGKAYSDYHLLIIKDYLDSQKMRIQSIPLSLVKSIQSFPFERQTKRVLMTFHKRKQIIRFSDGSVKYIGGLYYEAPKKIESRL